MKIFRVVMLCLACMGWLFAAATNKDADQTQKMILEEFDIDAKFLKSSHYASIKNSIKDGKRKELQTHPGASKNHKRIRYPGVVFVSCYDGVRVFKPHSF